MMILPPIGTRFSTGLLLVSGWFALTAPTVSAQGPAAPVRLKHQVTAEPLFGTIRPRGYLPVRITVQRQGTQAVAQRNITYYVYQKDRQYRGNGYGTQVHAHRMELPRGSASASAIFLLRGTNSKAGDSGIFVETDGDLRNSNRSSDVGTMQYANFLNDTSGGGSDASAVRCLFVSSKQLGANQKFAFSESAYDYSVLSVAPDTLGTADKTPVSGDETADSDVPTAWILRDVLSQDNQERYNRWMGGVQQTEEVVERPARTNRESNLSALERFEFMDHVAVGDLPETWQGLVPIDYLFISAANLKQLRAGRPAAWQAMREWVAAGGRLVLVHCGSKGESLREIEGDWFELGPGEVRRLWQRTSLNRIIASARDWGKNNSVVEDTDPETQQPMGSFSRMALVAGNNDPRFSSTGLLLSHCYLVAQLWNPESVPFGFDQELSPGEALYADYGAGRIVAVPGGYSDWDARDWKTVLATGLAGAPGPLLARSFGPETGFNFPPTPMPGIGEPPWFLFLGMITVFAIGIGPVAYSLLASRKKIPWILGLVPVVAGTLTAGLLVFAVLSEGLGTRAVRVSVTRLDANSGQSFTRTHFTIYSGTSPGGYSFDDHLMLFPDMNSEYEFRSNSFGGRQQMSGGGIRARTIHQLTMAEPHPTDASLGVEPVGGNGGSWKITNHTGADLTPLIARTDAGWLLVESLASEQSVTLEPIDTPTLIGGLTGILNVPGSRLDQLTGLKKKMTYNRLASGRPVVIQSWNNQFEANSWQANNDLWVAGLMTNPDSLSASIPVGGWTGMTVDWKLAGSLPVVTRYNHDFHVIHGRWK